jgi:hypothetical protein
MQNFIFIACKPGGKIGIYPRRNNLPFYAGKQCVENNHQKGYKLIPEAFPLMIKLPFFQFIRAFLFVLFLMFFSCKYANASPLL